MFAAYAQTHAWIYRNPLTALLHNTWSRDYVDHYVFRGSFIHDGGKRLVNHECSKVNFAISPCTENQQCMKETASVHLQREYQRNLTYNFIHRNIRTKFCESKQETIELKP